MINKALILIFYFLGLCISVSAQTYAIDRNAKIISGSGSYLSQGGDLFVSPGGNNAKIINLAANINYFTSRNFFIGGGVEFSKGSTKDYKSNSIGFGPQIGYVLGNAQSIAYPFLDIGIRRYKTSLDYDNASGSDIFFGFGMIIPVKSHIGLVLEGGYHTLNLKDDYNDNSISGNIFSLSAGFAGLLFHNVTPPRFSPSQ
ncbi:MAG: hypothetical protein GYA43_06670 [Bacteroidales bacterium]|nr:hypothetical protein [Bacteroidales bacterium]